MEACVSSVLLSGRIVVESNRQHQQKISCAVVADGGLDIFLKKFDERKILFSQRTTYFLNNKKFIQPTWVGWSSGIGLRSGSVLLLEFSGSILSGVNLGGLV